MTEPWATSQIILTLNWTSNNCLTVSSEPIYLICNLIYLFRKDGASPQIENENLRENSTIVQIEPLKQSFNTDEDQSSLHDVLDGHQPQAHSNEDPSNVP